MHCPKCGQEQLSDAIRYCSRCGFLLSGIAYVVANNGELPETNSGVGLSKRKRGVLQGLFIFLLVFLVVPVLTLISIALNAEPFAVVLATIMLTMGGLLRVAYALMFEPGATGPHVSDRGGDLRQPLPGSAAFEDKALPGSSAIPVSAYAKPAAGSWRDTNDLELTPGSVVENTTRQLE
ncbi:MAG TPA: zinc ribbon domain-containing protein [Pyrinomonadaceae bacterium]|nr:zinc ribbon domain-containing protein [Pyrinomonadaceae bacterium]HMP65737.1 zinc ribbon domain-containing protein [Pyrinomonadaceae bacterium]